MYYLNWDAPLEDTETLLKLTQLHLSMDEYQEAENYLLKALEKDADVADKLLVI